MNTKTLLGRLMLMFAFVGLLIFGAPRTARADVSINYGTGTTTYAFVNVSNATATVVSTYYRPDGTIESGSGMTYSNIVPNSRTTIVAGSSPDGPLPSSWAGSVILSSDQDIVAAARIDYTGKAAYESSSETGSTQGTEATMYDAFNAGSTELYVPSVFRYASGTTKLAGKLTVQNTTGTTANVYLNWTQDATVLGVKQVTLNPYGSVTYNTAVDADIPGLYTGNASVYITSTQPIVGAVDLVWDVSSNNQNWGTGYAMLQPAAASKVLYSPIAGRICFGGSCVFNNYNGFTYYTAAIVQNTTSATANVTATFITSAGVVAYTLPFQLSNKASMTLNLFNGANSYMNSASSPIWAALGSSFAGSIKFESDQPIVGYGLIQQSQSYQNYASAFKLVSDSDASSTVYLPWVDRVCTTTTACTTGLPYQEFPSFSGVSIVNVDASPVTLSSLTFYASNGSVASTITTNSSGNPIVIQPGASYSFNSRNGAGASLGQTQTLGNSFRGALKISGPTGSKLKAITTVVYGKISSDAYNGMNR
jgi:hypothetical protein